MGTKRAAKDMPYIDNYPPLKEWLEKNEARCNWQLRLGGDEESPQAFVESWFVQGGGEVIVVAMAHKMGWNLYTPTQSNGIAATFADADERLRRAPRPKTAATMEWEDVCHWIAQGAVNMSEGTNNTFEPGSKTHKAMEAFCTYVSEGLKPR